MKSWGLALSSLLVLLTSFLVSVAHTTGIDTEAPLGFEGQVRVHGGGQQASPERLTSAVAAFARQRDTAVAKVQSSQEHALTERHLYIAAGETTTGPAAWLQQGYPAFSQRSTTHVHPWGDIDLTTTDPRGYYLVGSSGDAADLAEAIRRTGFDAEPHPYLSPLDQLLYLLDTGLATTLAVAFLIAAVLLLATMVLGAKTYGVARLHGHGPSFMMRHDLGRTIRPLLLIAVPLSILATLALASFNGLAHLPFLLGVTATLTVTGHLVLALTYAVGLLLIHRPGISDAVKGRIPERPTLTTVYGLRLVASALAVTAVVAGIALHAPRTAAEKDLALAQSHATDTSFLLLDGAVGGDEKLMGRVTSWLQDQDEQGTIVLAAPVGDPGDALVAVNPAYFDQQEVQDAGGNRLRPEDFPGDRITLLTPSDAEHPADKGLEAARSEISLAAGVNDRSEPRVEIKPMGQATGGVFAYGASVGRSPVVVEDASIMVVPPELTMWGEMWGSLAEDIVIPDDTRDEALAGAPSEVLATQPVVEKMAGDARSAHDAWLAAVLTAGVSLVVLLASAAVCAVTYVRGWASTIFARFAHGWPRWKANPTFLLLEALVTAGLAGWLLARLASSTTTTPPGSIPVPRTVSPIIETLIALTVVLVTAITAVVTFAHREARSITDATHDDL